MKVGDRVRVVKVRIGLGADIGDTGVVLFISANKEVITVKWDISAVESSHYADQFEVIADPKIDYMQITRDIVGSR